MIRLTPPALEDSHKLYILDSRAVPNCVALRKRCTVLPRFQIRIPIDDMHTRHIGYTCYARYEIKQLREVISYYELPVPHVDARGEPEWSLLDNNSGENIAAWIAQSAAAGGLVLNRRLL
jgi:hypothetical protein